LRPESAENTAVAGRFLQRLPAVYTEMKGVVHSVLFLSFGSENVVLGNMGDSLTGMLLVNILYLV